MWARVTAIVAAVVLIAAATTVAVVQSRRAADAREQLAAAQARLTEVRAEVDRLRDQIGGAGGADPDPGAGGGNPLDELLGGDGSLGGLLEGLLGGDAGDLGGLLGGLGGALGGGNGSGPDVSGLLACVPPGLGGDGVPGDDAAAQIAAVSEIVADIRGLDVPPALQPEFLTGAQVADFFAQEIRESYPAGEADVDARILSAFGAVPPGTDLVQEQIDLLGEQVAGFYDDETKRLVVRSDMPGEPLGPVALITLSHELDHALVDAALGLPDLDGFGRDEDAQLAALAAVEGEAVLLQTFFSTQAVPLVDQLAAATDPAVIGSQEALNAVPPYLRFNLLFPYEAGPNLACAQYADGGWDAVDALLRTPPDTSLEVLDPARLGTVTPTDPRDPPGPGAGWEDRGDRTFGAAQLSWLLRAPGGDEGAALDDAVGKVAGWEGGEVHTWTRGSDTAVAMALDGAGLCDPVAAWYRAAFGASTDAGASAGEEFALSGGGQAAVLRCAGTEVRLGIGPTVDVARTVAG